MSDLSVDGAAISVHLEKIMAELSQTWEMVDGPTAPSFLVRRKYGDDLLIQYKSWSFEGPFTADGMKIRPSVPRIGLISEIFPYAVNSFASKNAEEGFRVTPDRCRLVWRVRPEIERSPSGDAYAFYARFAFMPKTSWILHAEETRNQILEDGIALRHNIQDEVVSIKELTALGWKTDIITGNWIAP